MLKGVYRSEYGDDWYYDDYDYIDDVDDIVYVVDDSICSVHKALNGGKKDVLTDAEMYLDDNELFVVAYTTFDGYLRKVDMGITKQEIISNVLANKYVNGAEYWTFGQMLKTTHDWMYDEVVE